MDGLILPCFHAMTTTTESSSTKQAKGEKTQYFFPSKETNLNKIGLRVSIKISLHFIRKEHSDLPSIKGNA